MSDVLLEGPITGGVDIGLCVGLAAGGALGVGAAVVRVVGAGVVCVGVVV